MRKKYEDVESDIRKIQAINIVPSMLKLICNSTGMGFAAIARVTDEKWIACSVLDEINFGLKPGGELPLETTICNEIRTCHKAVVIDNVSQDNNYRDHHTPKMYGFQSYISIPIILGNGDFFGTLCAIDPRPALLTANNAEAMFTLFAQLLGFHLHTMETLERTQEGYKEASDENLRYEHITYHNLREPVRKISIYSDLVEVAAKESDYDKMNNAAVKIKQSARQLAGMLQQMNLEA